MTQDYIGKSPVNWLEIVLGGGTEKLFFSP